MSRRRPSALATALGVALVSGCSNGAAGADAATDATAPADATVSFTAMTTVTTLGENCMPAVPPDPLALSGSLALSNTGTVALGPVDLRVGLVVRLLGGDTIATFAVDPVTLAAVAPGGRGSVDFTKTPGTLANDAGVAGCALVPCGTPVRIVLPLTGPNVPAGSRAASEPMTVPCTQ